MVGRETSIQKWFYNIDTLLFPGSLSRRHSRHHLWNLFGHCRTPQFDAARDPQQEDARDRGRGREIGEEEETVSNCCYCFSC